MPRPPMVKTGAVLTTSTGESVQMLQKFGEGGQGDAHHCVFRKQKMVAKIWLSGATTPAQQEELLANSKVDSPSDSFAWPVATLVGKEGRLIGYVMKYVGGKRIGCLADRMFGKCDATYWAFSTAGANIARSMLDLHGAGRAYCDLSSNNVLFDFRTGRAWIIDCDNVVRDGVDVRMIFTFGAACPSLVLGKERPSVATDRYSLSALLFMLLTGGSPLEGRLAATACAPEEKAWKRLYGSDPLFVFHPQNDRNRPHPVMQAGVTENWELLPEWLQEMFTRAFTVGLHDSDARYEESAWRDAMLRLRDSILVCPRCAAHNFTKEEMGMSCWDCKESIEPKRILEIGRRRVVLNRGASIYPHHIDFHRRGEIDTPIGSVIGHPANKSVWGLKNRSEANWLVETPGASSRIIAVNEVSPLMPGSIIQFPTAKAIVV